MLSNRAHLFGGLAVAAFGLVLLASAFWIGSGSVRDHVAGNYTRVQNTDPAYQGALVYHSDRPPARVVASITDKWKPARRHIDASAYFLRYNRDIVVVAPDPAGGSRIYVDDTNRGYARWYPYLGGHWGTYSGPGDEFRGGGPGAGK